MRHHVAESNHLYLLNRHNHPPAAKNHPLLTHNPHQLVPSLEIDLYAAGGNNHTPSAVSIPSRRFLSTHFPHVSLPESVQKSKVVYACRNPRDTFVSLWHFINKVRPQETGENNMKEVFDMFCEGVVGYGPFWDHVLGYWERSRESPDRVLFVKYKDMKVEPVVQLRRLAEFLDCPFSEEEEGCGVIDEILGLTSFESMKSVEVNRVGRLENGVENRHFFRKGVVGDWSSCLSAEMAEKLDRIVQDKFSGSGLVM